MSLRVNVENRTKHSVIVAISGRLDSETTAICEQKIAPLLNSEMESIIFDLTNLDYISSMGIRLILKTRKAIEKHGGKVVTTNLQPQIAAVFEIVQALPKEQIFSTIAEADRYFDVMQKRVLAKQDIDE